jgi:hypothetical protein
MDRALFVLTLFMSPTFLTMQLMFARQITDHDCRVILDPDFCYIQDHHTGHLVGTGPRCHDSQRLWALD